jgi:copper chaperone CopZ
LLWLKINPKSNDKANVDYDTKTAVVVYDDLLLDTVKLTEATKNAGYPSIVIESVKP